ncbi:hypothetical protein [Vibrio phage vB_pir03]|nr:hypothetical protein [Vibrio phage vB_pir03]
MSISLYNQCESIHLKDKRKPLCLLKLLTN